MDLADQFQSTVVDLFRTGGAAPNLLPLMLAQACVRVLPVAGAGLSMTDELRIPLAASDETAALAERLQTTLGEGPCLTAAALNESLVADAAAMTTRWPIFSQGFLTETPYRSVACVPLRSVDGITKGALDLYSVDPQPLDYNTMEEIDLTVGSSIASMLFHEPMTYDGDGFSSPSWLTTDAVNDRMNVWVAIGMLIERLELSNSDALAVLRGYAYSHGQTLDEIAGDLINKRLSLDQLLA